MNRMSQLLKSVITYIVLIGCICMHVSESSVTKGVLPLYSDTFDKVRIRVESLTRALNIWMARCLSIQGQLTKASHGCGGEAFAPGSTLQGRYFLNPGSIF